MIKYFIFIFILLNILTTGAGARAATPTLDSVYQLIKGNYALGPLDKLFSAGIVGNPYIDGLAIRTSWKLVEPSEGQYDWSYIDNALAQAQAAGKKASLSVAAGDNTPDWVYQAGIQTFRYIDRQPYRKTLFCTEVRIPVPYDPIYLAKWKKFVTAFGARYNGNPNVTKIRISGVNEAAAETLLPDARGEAIEGCDKLSYDDIQNWINAGYTASLIKNTLLDISKAFKSAFPDKGLSMAVYASGLPKINDLGKYDSTLDLAGDIFRMEISNIGPAFIPEQNNLSAFYNENNNKNFKNLITRYPPNSIIGFQMLWFVTGDNTYRMNNKVVGDLKTIFQDSVGKGINPGAGYLEIYLADVANPDFQDILRQAQKDISSTPRIFNVATSTVGLDSAIIKWNTYEPSNSQVAYGETASYGYLSVVDQFATTSHSIILTGLNPSKTYNYSVISKDSSGNTATSPNFSFITLLDITPPSAPTGLAVN